MRFVARPFAIGLLALALCCHAAVTFAQVPTYALKIKEVNSRPIVGSGVAKFQVAPGDRIQFDVYLRDWSPNGEAAAAVQAELDHGSFTTGESGTIQTIGYESTTLLSQENRPNVYIDQERSDFLHKGFVTLAIVNSNSIDPGHRWISVISQGRRGPHSRQNGHELYLGSFNAIASKDASGTFTMRLIPGRDHCGILTFDQEYIDPTDVEPAEVSVVASPDRRWITSSKPEFRNVDVRNPGVSKGVTEVMMRMSTTDEPGTFKIESSGGKAPGIKAVKAAGKNVRILLDGPLPAESWTTITHLESTTSTVLGRFHGDVDQDGARDFRDLRKLIEVLNKRGTIPLPQGDVDGNGKIDAGDLIELVEAVVAG